MSTVEPGDAVGDVRQARQRARKVAALLAAVSLALFELAVMRVAAGRSALPAPELPPAIALPAQPAPKVGTSAMRRQPFLPPLSAEAATHPGHGPLFTPDLAELTPVTAATIPAASSLAAALPPGGLRVPPPERPVGPEPPPAEARPLRFDLPTRAPLRLELDGSCPLVALGPFRLALGCR